MALHRQKHLRSPGITRYVLLLISASLMLFWLRNVNSVVREPYLDEVFHVRQTLAYWEHRWRQWDPKITTPPGLYLVSYLTGAATFSLLRYPNQPSAPDMRYVNGLVLFNLLPLSLRTLLKRIRQSNLLSGTATTSTELNLTALNICLFPPVFFFSGLYYTDLAALVIVLQVYAYDLKRQATPKLGEDVARPGYFSWSTLLFPGFGLLALVFRQTNIFWVAVFLGGLRVIRTLKSRTTECNASHPVDIIRSSWELGQLFDPLVSEAYFEDFVKTSVSVAISALANVGAVLLALGPYVAILGGFALFVQWNGAVVLGHKEFHTATLHLPQMLYIWPYILFFSWPVILPPLFRSLRRHVKSGAPITQLSSILPRAGLAVCTTIVMLAVVHLNTIVHPFTLADNRHYVFYVFRILRRHALIKYAVTPIYFLCAWLVLGAFGPSALQSRPAHAPPAKASSKRQPSRSAETKATRQEAGYPSQQGVRASFVLIWLVATSLSLITAPLVEPRYFIIPWVMWRLHIHPPSSWSEPTAPPALKTKTPTSKTKSADHNSPPRSSPYLQLLPTVAEFIWYVFINAATGYLFLYRGFEWPQEPGEVQRFMW